MPKAPRKCAGQGCTNRITHTAYCPDHTKIWEGSQWIRPQGWAKLREQILERDNYLCHVCGGSGADTADHVVSKANGGSDHPDNLAAIHDRQSPHCHRTKTNRERLR